MNAYIELKCKGIIAQKETFYVLLSLSAGLGEQGSGSYPIREVEPPSDLPSAEIVFADMRIHSIAFNESCYTAMIRCYCQHHQVENALKLFYEMVDDSALQPKLRTFSSIFLALVEVNNISTAFKLYEMMVDRFQIDPHEKEYLSLLRLCISHLDQRFYSVLDQMVEDILVPTSLSWEVFRDWFAIGEVDYQLIESEISSTGKVQVTGQQLQSIELDDSTRSQLLSQISSFATSRENNRASATKHSKTQDTVSKWSSYMSWLDNHRDAYNIIVDGANVGYYKQNYTGAPSHVDYHQINWLLMELQRQGYRPLLILHQRHTNQTTTPSSFHKLIQQWRDGNLLYESPSGCNDDWFWMYACVKLRCHIVTNDEMRDHHFQMLSPRWFARWKERHVVHFSFGKWKRYDHESTSIGLPPAIETLEQSGEAEDEQDKAPVSKKARGDAALRENSYREALCLFPLIYSHRMQIIIDEEGRKQFYFPACDKATWLCALPTK